jgi:hypothetical protein
MFKEQESHLATSYDHMSSLPQSHQAIRQKQRKNGLLCAHANVLLMLSSQNAKSFP